MQDFLPEAYDSNEESGEQVAPGQTNYSAEVLRLLQDLEHPAANKLETPALRDFPVSTKIYFASRTHSQLSQFAKEVGKVRFPSAVSTKGDEPVRMITLASRKNLCINSKVSKLYPEALNEACLELQDSKTPPNKRCRFLPKDESKKLDFRDHALASIQDIEDLVHLGNELQICPYYSTRLAIPPAELIALPYPLLLNKDARASLGIDLHNNIVIIDEAHNLVDAINSLSSASVSFSHLVEGQAALDQYMSRFQGRLKGKNKMYIAQLIRLIRSLIEFLSGHPGNGQTSPSELIQRGADAVNVHKLSKYMRASKLARKVDTYTQAEVTAVSLESVVPRSTPILSNIQSFLECLANPAREGVFFFQTIDDGEMSLKYLRLDPCHEFSDVVEEARSVVLAGGTMEPMSDFLETLFPNSLSRVQTFSCGHVIPETNLIALALASGPANCEFDFTFERRQDMPMLKDLGRAIANLVGTIPDGVVIFFPSYGYMSFVLQTWTNTGVAELLNKRKPIFIERKEVIVEETLRQYSASVNLGLGGILLAVVGGKMSEGINFSDALGRAVIMVGLPFPNANTAEWQAKLSYVERAAATRLTNLGATPKEAADAGRTARQEHFENVAMRAVNQSIGRAIRHQNDFASIILFDKRYGTERIAKKLPKWIRSGLQPGIFSFPKAMQLTGKFFKDKKKVDSSAA